MSCSISGCSVQGCRATSIYMHERLTNFLHRRDWAIERIVQATSRSEWGRTGWDARWEDIQNGVTPNDELTAAMLLLAASSPSGGWPDGVWTPRRAHAREAKNLIVESVRLARQCAAYGYSAEELTTFPSASRT